MAALFSVKVCAVPALRDFPVTTITLDECEGCGEGKGEGLWKSNQADRSPKNKALRFLCIIIHNQRHFHIDRSRFIIVIGGRQMCQFTMRPGFPL